MIEQVNSAEEVIDRLGGPTVLAKALGTTAKAVSNWRHRGFPPETYLILTLALEQKNLSAPSTLWKMRTGDPTV